MQVDDDLYLPDTSDSGFEVVVDSPARCRSIRVVQSEVAAAVSLRCCAAVDFSSSAIDTLTGYYYVINVQNLPV